jgi:hypothetical protein
MTEQVTDPNDLTKEDLLKLCAGRNPPIEGVNQRTSNAMLIALLWPAEGETTAPADPAEDLAGVIDPETIGAPATTLADDVMAVAEKILTPALCIGRVVYYWREEKHTGQMKVYPAMVTEVGENDVICLVAFGTPFGSSTWFKNIPMGGPQTSQSWSWPPAVETPEA